MSALKELFLSKRFVGKKLYWENWLDEPVMFEEFKKVIENCIKSINIHNINNLHYLYGIYLEKLNEYSKNNVPTVKRFFNITNCLGIDTKFPSSIEYQRFLGWSDEEIKQRGKLKYSTNTID